MGPIPCIGGLEVCFGYVFLPQNPQADHVSRTITLEIKNDTEALQSLPKKMTNLEQDIKRLVSRSDVEPLLKKSLPDAC